MPSIVIRTILAGSSVEMPLGDPAALLGEIKPFFNKEKEKKSQQWL